MPEEKIPPAQTPTQKTPRRLQSLDALRGFDMFFIMGGGALFVALATLFPSPFFQAIAEQMSHAQWNGVRVEDMIFPLFLFIAGISFPFSLEKQRADGRSALAIHGKIVRRGLTLVFLGIVYNGLLDFDFENQRYASVLGRIGLAWMFAALIFAHTKPIPRAWIAGILLVGYWLLLALVPAPDGNGAGVFSPQSNLASRLDRVLLPGKLHAGVHDPEGLLATVPAIATALLGMFVGEFVKLRKNGFSETKKVLCLLAGGGVLIAVGLAWDLVFPINKNLWTSSFVCFVGGVSVVLFAAFYYVIDVKNFRKWTFFFTVIGMNSITIYLAQRFFDFAYTSDAIFGGLARLAPENARPLLCALAYIAVCWAFLYFLYRRRIFLKV